MGERFVTQALLARKVDYAESDRVCTLLSRELGKISALARGARRSRRRFGGALSLFVLGEAELRTRPRSELLSLERFDSVEDLAPQIATDVVKVAHGSYVLELARELWPAQQPEPRVFSLVCQALRALAGGPGQEAQTGPGLLRAYELQLLRAIGVGPSFDRCVRCGMAVDADGAGGGGSAAGLSVTGGGAICFRCGATGWPLSREVLSLCDQLARTPLAEAGALAMSGAARRDLRDLMLMLLRHYLGKDLQSWAFLRQLATASPAAR